MEHLPSAGWTSTPHKRGLGCSHFPSPTYAGVVREQRNKPPLPLCGVLRHPNRGGQASAGVKIHPCPFMGLVLHAHRGERASAKMDNHRRSSVGQFATPTKVRGREGQGGTPTTPTSVGMEGWRSTQQRGCKGAEDHLHYSSIQFLLSFFLSFFFLGHNLHMWHMTWLSIHVPNSFWTYIKKCKPDLFLL